MSDINYEVNITKITIMTQAIVNQNSENQDPKSSIKEALVASEFRYRRLFESAKDVILIWCFFRFSIRITGMYETIKARTISIRNCRFTFMDR